MTTQTPTRTPPVRRRWTDRIGYLTAGWAALYATVALAWTVTGRGSPFGQGDPDSFGLLHRIPADLGAPVFAVVLYATAVMALIMTGPGPAARAYRLPLLAFGTLVAAGLLVVVPEVRMLALVGYAPVLIVGAPFGWPPDVDYAEVLTWPLLHQSISLAGGFLVAGTVLAWQLRNRREGRPAGWAAPAAAARWGRWAVAVAVVVPLVYAATRYAWLVGIPLLVDQAMLDDLHDTGGAWAGAWLATFAVIGSILTLGLVQRWGERFPRWMVGVAGRRVPVMLAVAPALLVSVLVTAAGFGLITRLDRFDGMFLLLVPHLLWPVWGVALAAAALAYYLRRSGPDGVWKSGRR